MKLAFHGGTSMKCDLVTDVEVSVRAGFKGLEVWGGKIDDYLHKNSLEKLRKLFVDNNLEPTSISSIEFIAFRGDEYKQIQDRCRELSIISEYIGCSTLVMVPSPTPQKEENGVLTLDVPWDEVVTEYVTVLRDLGDIAKPHGVKLAFEFIGSGKNRHIKRF